MEKQEEGALYSTPSPPPSPSSSRFKRVCVFCGSSPGKKATYQLAAIQLGHLLGYPQDTDAQRGGYGTLEELLEVITWAQLGIHDKPVGLLNVDGYYNSLLSFVDKAVDEGFIMPTARHIVVSAPTPQELLSKLEDYVPIHDGSGLKLSWEMEQIGLTPKSDISR
ncbi:Cytokinin riboside 5'-monophosphate phosphoribohydrolase LOG1 [Ananas comosus]|uniref:cytokinin riboside 5'-monophosphate phosphoribohydrolase n=1 Tax=Ananas comosus TaxID=4615 RepID=A0A199VHF4_ANACO|nr:Cytokinin riboside 5'-monophosphate phosphoribohydrolase LOG1 [Ananas comosus]